jgi:hypothetical protein
MGTGGVRIFVVSIDSGVTSSPSLCGWLQGFYAVYHAARAHIATLAGPNQDEIAAELRLQT